MYCLNLSALVRLTPFGVSPAQRRSKRASFSLMASLIVIPRRPAELQPVYDLLAEWNLHFGVLIEVLYHLPPHLDLLKIGSSLPQYPPSRDRRELLDAFSIQGLFRSCCVAAVSLRSVPVRTADNWSMQAFLSRMSVSPAPSTTNLATLGFCMSRDFIARRIFILTFESFSPKDASTNIAAIRGSAEASFGDNQHRTSARLNLHLPMPMLSSPTRQLLPVL